ncbi:hypothetical protein CJ030_MR1G000274 [Morella rubra]|uniref:Uncharacterized protein n=1 Tax=Morella rubra TaxID=262757 RepID=A0A6A1WRN6_9ROSI|nr:hypothetical protein CJ030_MR1G000274 [Morella rubra]
MSLVFEASAMHSQEFYHRQPSSARSGLPRIFGMTASPIKTKSGVSEFSFWQKIKELEDLMDSKVYTCASESELAQSIPFSTPKFNFYRHKEIPSKLYEYLAGELQSLKEKHELLLKRFDLRKSGADCISKKISKIFSALIFCLDELGVWLSLKVAQSFSCSELGLCEESDAISWGKLDVLGEAIVKDFSSDASHAFATCVPSGPDWSIGDNVEDKMKSGLLTAKVVCLIESLLEYRDLKDIRCIVFVERIITAVVVDSLLNELLLKYSNWKSKYIAGNYSGLQSQTRKKQNEIVQEFREGMVNIIVATSILEEGLDVQSCNLVIRFDPSSTVCSFIQSRGRARRQHSDYILMVKSEDFATNSRLEKYLASEDIMRKASLRHASLPCSPLQSELNDEEFYCVESTGAIVTRTFSVGLIYFYCSRLPSDCYFKPAPGGIRILALYIYPKLSLEECGRNEPCIDEQPSYVPPELVGRFPMNSDTEYHCYLIELKQNFAYDVPVHDVVLVMRNELESDVDHYLQEVYEERHGIKLRFVHESMVNGRHIFPVKNYLLRCRKQKEKESSNSSVELPPELCSIVMSPISIATFYTFSFVPSIMHRLESLLVAVNLKKMHLDHCIQNDVIPISKVLEAITTNECQERFHLESLETLGDSFLKYAACQQLFKTYQNQREGELTAKKEKIISNEALFKFGCDRKLPGFIRNEIFDPKNWIVPGDRSGSYALSGETSALLFMAWLGMKRLEFLGDSVLDYLMTTHFYHNYPGLSPGQLTDMRSASVNNECYALSAVLADVIESLAGAILVDSGYNTKKVFQSMRRLLEPLVTPETVPSHPAKELKEICQKEHYIMKDPIKSRDRGFTSVTIEVEAKGLSFKHTATAAAETTANKVACQQVLKSLKDSALYGYCVAMGFSNQPQMITLTIT